MSICREQVAMGRLLLRWREPQDKIIGIGNEHVECYASALAYGKSVAGYGILEELCKELIAFASAAVDINESGRWVSGLNMQVRLGSI
jgi:hypothetical protein